VQVVAENATKESAPRRLEGRRFSCRIHEFSPSCRGLDQETPQSRTLKRALELAGTPERLAELLQSPIADVMGWLAGQTPLPAETYLRALDVVAHVPRVVQDRS
jgi:hypothetical protein